MRAPLDIPPPYDFELSTFRYRVFGDDLASRWHDGGLYRVLASDLPVRIDAEGVASERPLDGAEVAEVRHLLGAGFDTADFASAHPDIAARAPGFRPPLMADAFEMLVTSVTAQQISLRAACAIRNALVSRHGRPHVVGETAVWRFPAPERLRGGALEGLGLSAAKARAIRALAIADLAFEGLADEEIRRRLLAVPGVGGWTADWFFARCLGRPDAFAAGDLGVRKAVTRWLDPDAAAVLPEGRVRDYLAGFGRRANLAAHYLLVPPQPR